MFQKVPALSFYLAMVYANPDRLVTLGNLRGRTLNVRSVRPNPRFQANIRGGHVRCPVPVRCSFSPNRITGPGTPIREIRTFNVNKGLTKAPRGLLFGSGQVLGPSWKIVFMRLAGARSGAFFVVKNGVRSARNNGDIARLLFADFDGKERASLLLQKGTNDE
jgi:hypothetical protein